MVLRQDAAQHMKILRLRSMKFMTFVSNYTFLAMEICADGVSLCSLFVYR